MNRNNNVSPEVFQAKMKANLIYSKLLDFVRNGNTYAIRLMFESKEYSGLTRLILGDDLDYARTVMQFLAPQITRAAIDGGMGELDAAAIYLNYMGLAKEAASSDELQTLSRNILIDYAEQVSALHLEEQFSPFTTQCLNYINEHVYDLLTARDIAAALHVSRSYLSHVYKIDTGKTIGERIRAEKITMARFLLLHTTLNLAEISEKLGFSSQSRFTEIFRKVVGVTPKKYRGFEKKQNR